MTYKSLKDFNSEPEYVRYLHKEELAYNENLENKIAQGIMHPFLHYWHKRLPTAETKPTTESMFKQRYQVCRQCENFINITKQCKKCYCFIPMKAQFEIFKCPEGKW